jgi:hypothetical protein
VTLSDRIELHMMLRRADNVIRHAYIKREHREQLNRPHVPSVHMVGHWVQPPAPTVRDLGITRRYVALLLVLAFTVFYINTSPEAATKLGCYRVASK